jgi:hypothetical protein
MKNQQYHKHVLVCFAMFANLHQEGHVTLDILNSRLHKTHLKNVNKFELPIERTCS